MNQSHPRLLAAIREACPETMEICEGCVIRVLWLDDTEPENVFYSGRDMRLNGTMEVIEDNITGEIVEVIGHEIRLEHVLRTLNKTKEWACASDGTFLESVDTDRFHHHDVRCDLTKPVSDWPKETLDFLDGVICG